MSCLGSWSKGFAINWKTFKSGARDNVAFKIQHYKEADYPVELEVACFLIPWASVIGPREPVPEIPGSVFFFKGTINNASEFSAFLENELEPLEIPAEHGIGIESYWHEIAREEYRWSRKEIEAKELGLPPLFEGEAGEKFRDELDRKLQNAQ